MPSHYARGGGNAEAARAKAAERADRFKDKSLLLVKAHGPCITESPDRSTPPRSPSEDSLPDLGPTFDREVSKRRAFGRACEVAWKASIAANQTTKAKARGRPQGASSSAKEKDFVPRTPSRSRSRSPLKRQRGSSTAVADSQRKRPRPPPGSPPRRMGHWTAILKKDDHEKRQCLLNAKNRSRGEERDDDTLVDDPYDNTLVDDPDSTLVDTAQEYQPGKHYRKSGEPPRSVVWKKHYHSDSTIQKGLERRGPVGKDKRSEVPALLELPSSVGPLNIMVANWAIGEKCDSTELLQRLQIAPFDILVVTLTAAVAETWHDTFQFLHAAEARRPGDNVAIEGLIRQKVVHQVLDRVWVVFHRAKIVSIRFHSFDIRERCAGIQFGTLHIKWDTSRQRLENMNLGILDGRNGVVDADVNALVEWAVKSKLGMVTGHFGNDTALWRKFAIDAGATFSSPMYQAIARNRSRGAIKYIVHPTYWILFGSYYAVSWPKEDAELENGLELGDDIEAEMMEEGRVATWPQNVDGSPHVPYLGRVRMQRPDWERWFDGGFQTILWAGTSMPSHASREKQKIAKALGIEEKWGNDRGRKNTHHSQWKERKHTHHRKW